MVTIKRLTEEIGFEYANKMKDTSVTAGPGKKKNPMMDMLMPFLKPIVKSAYDAGKSGENFDTWWNNYMENEMGDFGGGGSERPRASMGFKRQ